MRITYSLGFWLLSAAVVNGEAVDPRTRESPIIVDGITISMPALRTALAEQADLIRFVAEETGEVADFAAPRGGPPGLARLVHCNGLFGHDTIQGAIDAAEDGDVIVILPNTCNVLGRWYENINPMGKRLRIQCADPANSQIVELTVIDGSLASPQAEFRSVVTCTQFEGADTVFHGLTFTNGIGTSGGGLYCWGRLPSLWDCRFVGNTAHSGGGIYGTGIGSTALGSGDIRDCLFAGNTATGAGGAIYIRSSTLSSLSTSSIDIQRCSFVNNTAGNGAAMYMISSTGQATSSPVISNCAFTGNTSTLGSIVDMHTGTGNAMSSPLFSNCTFTGNQSDFGSLFVIDAGTSDAMSSPKMTSCRFSGNTSSTSGGMFKVTGGTGDAVAHPVFQSCQFDGNSVDSGALFDVDSGTGRAVAQVTCRSCLISGNTARGGLLIVDAGISGSSAYADIESCTVVNNICDMGSLLWVREGPVSMPSEVSIRNSIFWGNRIGAAIGEFFVEEENALLSIAYSDFEYLDVIPASPAIQLGAGNFSLVPEFVDPGGIDDAGTSGDLTDDTPIAGDYHLLVTSPCTDVGDASYVAADGDKDFEGEPRIMTCRLDVGADEFNPVRNSLDFNADGLVTLNDLPQFVAAVLGVPVECSRGSGDANQDGRVDGLDIGVFVAAVLQ